MTKTRTAKATTRRVTWPALSYSVGTSGPSKISRKSLATISDTSKTLKRALKRLADK